MMINENVSDFYRISAYFIQHHLFISSHVIFSLHIEYETNAISTEFS